MCWYLSIIELKNSRWNIEIGNLHVSTVHQYYQNTFYCSNWCTLL